MTDITVEICRRTNGTHYLLVKLKSIFKPEVWSYRQVELDKYTNERDFLREVAISAGAIAEHQGELYGDNHDPDECAKVACELAVEVLRGQ